MSFADPQSITIDSAPISLPRISTSSSASVYKSADEAYRLDISHQETKAKRTRRMARITSRVVAADPLTALNEYKEGSVYLVVDEPEYGFTDADLAKIVGALSAWLAASTNTAKLLGSEH